MKIPITPVTITRSWDIAEIEYRIIDFIPGASVTFSIGYLDFNGKYIDHPNLLYSTLIDGEEYEQWGNVDGYIIQVLMTRVLACLSSLV